MGDKLGTTGLTIFDHKMWGYYRAVVLDNNDPLELGRIKAQVIPYFVGIDESIIPWAKPKNRGSSGAGVGFGDFHVPNEGTMVWVFFEAGDVYQPVYDGDANDGVFGLPDFRTTNYPNRRGFTTICGVTFYIDDTAKVVKLQTAGGIIATIDDTAETVKVEHPTGTYVYIDPTGKVTVYSVSDTLVQSTTKIDVTAPIINLRGSTSVNINPV
jgi:Type VI secretion system/phage-baseplate injector OB domain